MENPSRRRVLTAGLTGAVATALMGSRVSATTPPPAPPVSEPPPGTDPESTEAPQLPTEGDVPLLAFVQQAELAARDLYVMAIEAGAAGDEDRVLQAAHDNHQAAADALSAMLGVDAPQRPDDAIVAELESAFAVSDLAAVAEAGYELENTLVATHTELVGQLEGVDGMARVAAILVAEARMAAVMADVAGLGDDLDAMFDNSATALAVAEG